MLIRPLAAPVFTILDADRARLDQSTFRIQIAGVM